MIRAFLGAAACLLLGMTAAQAADASLVGRWRTIDDETNTERSIVEITEVGGEMQGRVVKIFYRADEKPDPVCEKCEGERKDKPVIGMVFLWGLKPQDKSNGGGNAWTGGAVLDPKNGKIYNAKATLEDGGKTLKLRGYLGMPLLGRSQIWRREAE